MHQYVCEGYHVRQGIISGIYRILRNDALIDAIRNTVFLINVRLIGNSMIGRSCIAQVDSTI